MFKILAMGDSVMWGQGLSEKEKFTGLTQQYLEKEGQTVELTLLAHSGSRLLKRGFPAPNYGDKFPYLYGEIPKAHPGQYTQLFIAKNKHNYSRYLEEHSYDIKLQKKHKQKVSKNIGRFRHQPPNLILLNGGINDLDATQIISPFTTRHSDYMRSLRKARGFIASLNPRVDKKNFEFLVEKFVYQRMAAYLTKVRTNFPESTIIVTGYYPLFTAGMRAQIGTDMVGVIEASALSSTNIPFGVAKMINPSFLIRRSNLWYELSSKYLRKAIRENRGGRQDPGMFFAEPEFGKYNGAFCKNSYLFSPAAIGKTPEGKIQIGSVNDKKERVRKRAFDKYADVFESKKGERHKAYRASLAHPNEAGARAYFCAIEKVLLQNRQKIGF